MNSEHADAFLVEAIREGQQWAWRELIGRYHGRLLAFARSRAPTAADAEDIVQETFVGFATSIEGFDATRSLETYLFTIARYKIYDVMRQKKLPAQTPTADADDWWDHVLPGDGESPSTVASRREDHDQQGQLLATILRRLIHELRDREAFQDLQAIELVFFAGKRNLEVAALIDMDQKAVAGVKFRAIQRLRRYLEEGYSAALSELDDPSAELTVSSVWRHHRLTCLKRGTLGSYLLGLLDDPWKNYTRFHLEVVGCPLCRANLEDLKEDEEGDVATSETRSQRLFMTSVGFLKAGPPEG